MIRAYVGSELILTGLSPEQTRTWQARATYDNPAFAAARRDGRFTGPTRDNPEGIPERLRLWRAEEGPDGEALVLPRGLLSAVEDALRPELRDLRVCPPLSAPFRLSATLRDYQLAAVSTIQDDEQGVIQAPTGSGKTVIGLGLIAALGTPALFVVHTRVLLDQTAESMAEMLGVTPGRIGDGKCVVGDVTVAMVQTLMRATPGVIRDLSRRFGLVILDEAHHAPAASFRKVIAQFPARYRVGLTATPTRKDGLHGMLYDVIGPVAYRVAPSRLIDSGAIVPAEVVKIRTRWIPRPKKEGESAIPMVKRSEAQTKRIESSGRKVRQTVDYGRLIALLVESGERNQVLVDSIVELHEERSLVLTERVEHAKRLADALTARGLRASAMTGDCGKVARSVILSGLRAGTLPVLVSTPHLVGEGFNLPTIDTVFLAAPNGNIAKTTQLLGRVLRPSKGKTRGRIVDFRDDDVPLLRGQAAQRDRVYRTFERAPLALGRVA